jgi:hypothetical protein
MIFVSNRGANPVFGAEVANEDGDDQGVGLVAGHLYETGRAELPAFFVPEVAKELHLEQAA